MSRNQIKDIPRYIDYRFGEGTWEAVRARRIAGGPEASFKIIARDLLGDSDPTTANRWWRQYLESPEGLADKEAQATKE